MIRNVSRKKEKPTPAAFGGVVASTLNPISVKLTQSHAKRQPAISRSKTSNGETTGGTSKLFEQALITTLERATEVIGEKSDAMRWLGTPVRALNYATPISLLHSTEGQEAVLSVLGRIEHGVF